jgi:hypothetical protein
VKQSCSIVAYFPSFLYAGTHYEYLNEEIKDLRAHSALSTHISNGTDNKASRQETVSHRLHVSHIYSSHRTDPHHGNIILFPDRNKSLVLFYSHLWGRHAR